MILYDCACISCLLLIQVLSHLANTAVKRKWLLLPAPAVSLCGWWTQVCTESWSVPLGRHICVQEPTGPLLLYILGTSHPAFRSPAHHPPILLTHDALCEWHQLCVQQPWPETSLPQYLMRTPSDPDPLKASALQTLLQIPKPELVRSCWDNSFFTFLSPPPQPSGPIPYFMLMPGDSSQTWIWSHYSFNSILQLNLLLVK
jgi:hypothetical protein